MVPNRFIQFVKDSDAVEAQVFFFGGRQHMMQICVVPEDLIIVEMGRSDLLNIITDQPFSAFPSDEQQQILNKLEPEGPYRISVQTERFETIDNLFQERVTSIRIFHLGHGFLC